MGFFDNLKDKTLDSISGGVSSALGGKATSMFEGMLGMNEDPGNEYRKFLDQAFPQLNQWEQSGAQGAAGAALESNKMQQKLKTQELNSTFKLQKSQQQHEERMLDKTQSFQQQGYDQKAVELEIKQRLADKDVFIAFSKNLREAERHDIEKPLWGLSWAITKLVAGMGPENMKTSALFNWFEQTTGKSLITKEGEPLTQKEVYEILDMAGAESSFILKEARGIWTSILRYLDEMGVR